MKTKDQVSQIHSIAIVRPPSESANPAPLYRQEKADAWDAVLHTLLELCLPVAILLCGLALSGAGTPSSLPVKAAIAQTVAHVTPARTSINAAGGFPVAAR